MLSPGLANLIYKFQMGEISLPPCLVLPSHHNKKEVSHLAGLWAWGLCYRNPRDTHTRTLLTNQINLTPIA